MPAPLKLVHSHSYSLRIASGAEALLVRVRTSEGTLGLGFTLNLDARPARDMAAWDAWAKQHNQPLWQLLGGSPRQVALLRAAGEASDPWEIGSLDALRKAHPRRILAPHAHPWEIAWCATLAASLAEDSAIALPGDPALATVELPRAPGHGIDWSHESGFARIAWDSTLSS